MEKNHVRLRVSWCHIHCGLELAKVILITFQIKTGENIIDEYLLENACRGCLA